VGGSVEFLELLRYLEGSVRGAVVDDDDFVVEVAREGGGGLVDAGILV
jgi:hypothetical protein